MTLNIKHKLFFTLLLLSIPTGNLLFGDTIHLDDGSIVVGKIIKKKGTTIIFANSYGTFTIKRKSVKKIYKSKSYKDDIRIQVKLGKKMNKISINKIKKDFQAGLLLKEKEEKNQSLDKLWDFHRFSIYFNYFNTEASGFSGKRNVNDILPHGLELVFSHDYGFEKFLKKHMMLLPGIRIDSGFTFYADDFSDLKKNIIAISLNAGPMWILPSIYSSWGYFSISILPGISIMGLTNNTVNYKNIILPFTIKSSFSYGYTFDKISLQFVFNYNYIQDVDVSFHAIGGSVGVSFNFN